MSTITRFAPSPTGYLHVGGARTALFSWLLARHEKGQFLLRIEDTDLARSTEAATTQLLEDLRWLGLPWDNQNVTHQSRRLEVYNGVIDELMSRDLAYEAWETDDELDAERAIAKSAKKSFVYRRRDVAASQIATWKSEGRRPAIRFSMPVMDHSFFDIVRQKDTVVPAEEVQDIVIRRTDGMPLYNLVATVDDAAMGVTHVLRGQEHLLNTHPQMQLQKALGYPHPLYGHLGIVQNPDGSKMGKRDRDKKIRLHAQLWIKNGRGSAAELATRAAIAFSRVDGWLKDSNSQLDLHEQAAVMPVIGLAESDLPEILVHDFRRNGYLPEVLLNFLALLGWNPGADREHMSIEEMIDLFSVDRINAGNSKFGRDKLLAFNTDACAKASPARLVAAMRDYLSVNPDSPLNAADAAMLERLLHIKKGFRTLREVDQSTRFLFVADEQIEYDPNAVEKVLRKQDRQGFEALRAVQQLFAEASDWTHGHLESLVKQYCERTQLGLGKVAQPIRVAVSGSTVSPPIFESLELLGKARTLARVERCLSLRN